MFIHFFSLCNLGVTIKLNFNISKVAYSKGRHEKLASAVRVLQNTQNLVFHVVLQRTAKKRTKIPNAHVRKTIVLLVRSFLYDVLVGPSPSSVIAKTPCCKLKTEPTELCSGQKLWFMTSSSLRFISARLTVVPAEFIIACFCLLTCTVPMHTNNRSS